jgi:homodimeric pyruvate:ferredoxin (flavodoxin) oxidoreductase
MKHGLARIVSSNLPRCGRRAFATFNPRTQFEENFPTSQTSANTNLGKLLDNDIHNPSWDKLDRSKLRNLPQKSVAYDGSTAAVHSAYAWSEQSFIYPITPATGLCDKAADWAGSGRKNIFNEICQVTQMQSEGGAAGAVHGVLEVGSLCTTFTSSQGLLLMIPNMYIIAGMLNPCVFHVPARALSKVALCIFGDHTDVMATRQTGWALLASKNVQEAHDLATVAHIATLRSSVPFIHFFDGFRTSHEQAKIQVLSNEAMIQLMPWDALREYRRRGLNPSNPHTRNAGMFTDSFFQAAETGNLYYDAVPGIMKKTFDDYALISGRHYRNFEYTGHPEATDVVILMGSGVGVAQEYVNYAMKKGEKLGVLNVRLFRPWSAEHFIAEIPKSAQTLTVLDRTKEAGSIGEPLYMDVATTLQKLGMNLKVLHGRYGLGSKEFSPGMVSSVFANSQGPQKTSFSVGITDDVSFRSLPIHEEPDSGNPNMKQCMFFGMGSDGMLSANKNAIKMIADETPLYTQAYFAYTSHKAGGATISHLRFGPEPIDMAYGITKADYTAVSESMWLKKFPEALVKAARPESTIVLNLPAKTSEDCLKTMHPLLSKGIATKNLKVYTIDARLVARKAKLGRHTNNILQAVFFKLSGVLPFEEAIALLKDSMRKSYASKGDELIQRNINGVDMALDYLTEIKYNPQEWIADAEVKLAQPSDKVAPHFVENVQSKMASLSGDQLTVSEFNPRGHWVPGMTAWEKRGIALTVPVVDMDKCTQCNQCSMICPHAAIRPFLVSQLEMDKAPKDFSMNPAKGGAEVAGLMYRIQVAPEDCTGCEACSWTCKDEALTMTPLSDVINVERENWNFSQSLTDKSARFDPSTVKGSQFQKPLLEFSGACEGCGETPYGKLVTQLFGDRMVIANASGCSSVWAGSAGSSSLTVNDQGRGPAWGRSLFEDAAEYGFGMARALKQRRDTLAARVEDVLVDHPNDIPQILRLQLDEWYRRKEDAEIASELSMSIPKLLSELPADKFAAVPNLKFIQDNADCLTKISPWIWGGDGWAYDIGFGGLDHVLSAGSDINILIYDTEGYSNTGGQVSKATQLGAVQKFSPEGYRRAKKDMGSIAMSYQDVYVASISLGASWSQSVKALTEAESYPGTSIVLCYSPCIEHKIKFPRGLSHLAEEMAKAVKSGYWSLYRYDPRRVNQGLNPFQLDFKRLTMDMAAFTKLENRFGALERTHPEVAKELAEELHYQANMKMNHMVSMAQETSTATGSTFANLAILVGSDTGTTLEVAQRVAEQCRQRSFGVSLFELDELEAEDLSAFSNVLLMCSTAGEGALPGNAHAFWESLSDTNLDADLLKNVKLATFGMGDSSYHQFNAAAKQIHARFLELGAQEVMPVGLGNDQDEDKYETALEDFVPGFMKAHQAPVSETEKLIMDPIFEVTPLAAEDYAYEHIVPPGGSLLNLEFNKRLTSDDYDREIRHLSFDLKGTDFSYLLGDALNIYPVNDPDQVQSFLEMYAFNPLDVIQIDNLKPVDKRRKAAYRKPVTYKQLFEEVVDILGRPNKYFYKQLAKFARNPSEQAELELISSDSEAGKAAYNALVAETQTYADILGRFRSARLPIEHLLSLIPLIKPRLYSIASSQRYVNDKVELAVVILDWQTKSRAQTGLGTSYIRRLANTTNMKVACSLTAGSFKFPTDRSTPMVMAGLGTGLAPFRAFVQEWAYWKQVRGEATGPMWLFYGCRYQAKDYIFADELEKFEKEGVITSLRPAFSRDTAQKVYVQHKMKAEADKLYEDLVNKKGYFYLCGQAGQLEVDINRTVTEILETQLSKEDAEKEFEKIKAEERWGLELY